MAMDMEKRNAVLAAIMDLKPVYGYANVPDDLVLAQSALETGWWTSNLCVTYNNCFGMMHPNQRDTVSLGPTETGRFATYPDIFASVQDYFMRQEYFGIPGTSSASEYIAATVASGYATDPNYAKKWNDVYEQISGTGSTTPGTGPGSDPKPESGSTNNLLMIGGLALLAFLLMRKK